MILRFQFEFDLPLRWRGCRSCGLSGLSLGGIEMRMHNPRTPGKFWKRTYCLRWGWPWLRLLSSLGCRAWRCRAWLTAMRPSAPKWRFAWRNGWVATRKPGCAPRCSMTCGTPSRRARSRLSRLKSWQRKPFNTNPAGIVAIPTKRIFHFLIHNILN